MEIIELSERPERVEEAVKYFWTCWGSESNYIFYKDCITNSLNSEKDLPKFYILTDQEKIIGSYALLTNDIISRQDLMPWFACLYVDEKYRTQGLGGKLLHHGLQQAKIKGFDELYLSSDLINFYEKKGWKHICQGYNVFGEEIKIYAKNTGLVTNEK